MKIHILRGHRASMVVGGRCLRKNANRAEKVSAVGNRLDLAPNLGHRFASLTIEGPIPASKEAPTPSYAATPVQRKTGHGQNGTPRGATEKATGPSGQRLTVRASPIHGKGVFAQTTYSPGERIELGATAQPAKEGRDEWALTRPARYTNHQSKPNAKVIKDGAKLVMAANQTIRRNDEVTVDYNQVGSTLGAERMSWRGRLVPEGGAEDFFRKN